MAHPLAQAQRLCLFSHWSADGEVALYVRLHLEAIRAAGYAIAFVSAGPLTPAAAAALQPLCGLVAARENVGYDFGNWGHALQRIGESAAERLLLLNDSVYGPFAPLDGFLRRLEAQTADIWGAVRSDVYGRHLQSWWLLLGPAAIASFTFRTLMHAPVDPALSKWALVQRYEIGLSQGLLAEGLRLGAAYVAEDHGALARLHPHNPCGLLWRELVEGPVPYIKTSMLRANPTLAPGIGGWRRVADRLDPRIAAAAAADLAARRARPPTTLAARWRASLTRAEPSEWPEVQAVLRADRGVRVAPLGEAAYAAAARLGAAIRRSACAPRPRGRTVRPASP